MRKPIIFGNWKMNKNRQETTDFLEKVEPYLCDVADFGIAVPYTCLDIAKKYAHKMLVAAENCHYEDKGAYTGEIAIPMLQELNVEYCIIGHSERRAYYNETNESVNLKAKKLLASGMYPIVCVGENLIQFENGETEAILKKQIEESLKDISYEDMKKVTIAYEPIWAIGTGKNANSDIAEKCCHYIREVVATMINDASEVRIQYGGSVTSDNIALYLAKEDIDGALVGGAALKEESFIKMIEAIKGEK